MKLNFLFDADSELAEFSKKMKERGMSELLSRLTFESSYTRDTAAEETLRKILRAAAKNESASITIEGKTGPALSPAHCKAIAEFYEIVQAPQNISKKAQFIKIFGNLRMFVGMLKSPLFKETVARYVEAEKAVPAEPVSKSRPHNANDVYTKPGRQGKKSEFEPLDIPVKKKSEFEPLDFPVKKKTDFTDFKSFMKTSPETYFSDKKVDPLTATRAIKTYKDIAKRGTNEKLTRASEEAISEQWDDSAAKDAEGRWAKYRDGQIGVTAMAKWLYSSRVHKSGREDKLKSAYGAIAQQQNTSKLISASQADALRAKLKKLYPTKS